jgi:hypothetical protein
MAVWQYIPTDNHTLDHLYAVLQYYTEVEESMFKELEKALKYEKYGLPNWRTEVIRREVGWEDALNSLNNIEQAIMQYNQENL